MQKLFCYGRLTCESQLRLKLCRQVHVKQKKAMLKFLVIYGRLHTRVNYDSNCVVKPCKIKTIRCKNYFAMLDSTRESISTQTVSGHAK